MTTIVQLFEAQAAKTPDTIAVRYEQEDLTYAELNDRANQLAHFLRKMGVGREQIIGLFLERSLEMVVSLIGVLKTGGAYVPLDPDYPSERILFMLEDTRVPVVLTQSHLTAKLSTIQNVVSNFQKFESICLDTEWEEVAQERTENPAIDAAPANLAYTIYTSGSTGQPKGVMNEHRGIYNRMVWMLETLPLTKNDRVLQKTPYSFDVSIWEFFWPLLSGARLVIAKPGGHKDSKYLVNLIVEQEITAIHFVPSMLQVFLLNDGVDRCRSLRHVFCSGEALSYELQERFFSRLGADLFNLYGPTEAAIEVTFWACQRESGLKTVPIGYPLPNTQIHVLDSKLRPVLVGEQGELHIGGVQVARGYLNRPDLTAERFIPDPFSADPNARLYKTGDLASYLPDGTILYHGRLDYQVKIRGNRVELGEIESALARHPRIREAVVIAYESVPGDKRLAAYLITNPGDGLSLSELRDFLAAKLPEYMLPATWFMLDSFPLTPSGKVNRRALPTPDRVRPNLSETYVAPRNPIEEKLARIWEQVIGLDKVGIHDNFLELGGDSILSIQITSRINQVGLRLSPAEVLQYQTIAELAAVASESPIVRAEQETITGSLPLTPIQRRFFESHPNDPNNSHQTLVLEVQQGLNALILEQVVRQLQIHHDALRTRFIRNGTNWEQVMVPPDTTTPFSHIELPEMSADAQKATLDSNITELQAGLDLSQGILMQVALIDFGAGSRGYLVIVIHPLLIDEVSWRILLEDLELLYQQLIHNQPVELPPKTTSYKYWAERLGEHGKSDSLQSELPFWLSGDEARAARLPVDSMDGFDGTVVSTYESVSVSISVEDTQTLLTNVPKAYRTLLTDVLLTAFAEAFFRWTGRTSLLVDLEGHGREAIFSNIDISRSVGCFSAIYPVVLDIDGATDPGEKLMMVKERLRQIGHGGIGYGVLRYLGTGDTAVRELQALPRSEVSFHHLGQVDNLLGSISIFKPAPGYPYPSRSLPGGLRYWIETTSGIFRGQLQLTWTFNNNFYKRATIENLAHDYLDALADIISHCTSSAIGRYTPSDFPEANLSQQELDDLLNEIDEFEE